jgi:hypothetical protein
VQRDVLLASLERSRVLPRRVSSPGHVLNRPPNRCLVSGFRHPRGTNRDDGNWHCAAVAAKTSELHEVRTDRSRSTQEQGLPDQAQATSEASCRLSQSPMPARCRSGTQLKPSRRGDALQARCRALPLCQLNKTRCLHGKRGLGRSGSQDFCKTCLASCWSICGRMSC